MAIKFLQIIFNLLSWGNHYFSDPNKWTEKLLENYLLPYEKVILLDNKFKENFTEKYFDIFSDLSKEFFHYYNLDYKVFHPLLKRGTIRSY